MCVCVCIFPPLGKGPSPSKAGAIQQLPKPGIIYVSPNCAHLSEGRESHIPFWNTEYTVPLRTEFVIGLFNNCDYKE